MARSDRAVVAIGGNSLITDPKRPSVERQFAAARETDHHIGALVADGLDVTVVHGNGPQVGFILLRSELARAQVHEVPLDVCVADTQGAIGYILQQSLADDLRDRGIERSVVSVVTQVEVAPDDPAFAAPTKPIGPFLDAPEADRRRREDGWEVAEDADRGWRRVVASPRPQRIVELEAIQRLVEGGSVVIACGGGGIPVVRDGAGRLQGVAAVIDKDHAAALLARQLDAGRLVISTAVERVALEFGTPRERPVDHLTLDDARTLLAEGRHFAPGSMAPKVEAIVDFLEAGGDEAIVTTPQQLEAAVAGRAGTRFTR